MRVVVFFTHTNGSLSECAWYHKPLVLGEESTQSLVHSVVVLFSVGYLKALTVGETFKKLLVKKSMVSSVDIS